MTKSFKDTPKEVVICKCGHSKKSHLITFDINMCCCVWQVSGEKEAIEKLGSLLRFCECKGYEEEKPNSDVSSKGEDKCLKIFLELV